jgi:hypothetical protein
MRRPLSRLLKVVVPLLVAAGMTFGAAAADPRQEAHADQWQMYLSNNGVYCEGCCKAGSLCCSINSPCRVSAPEDPAGGG